MKQPNANRFGWGSLLAAFFGGALLGQGLGDNPPSKSSEARAVSDDAASQIETFAALPNTVSEAGPEPAPETDFVEVEESKQLYDQPIEPTSNVYFRNCSAARAAGAAPVYLNEPGYASHLDRDGDGVGCE